MSGVALAGCNSGNPMGPDRNGAGGGGMIVGPTWRLVSIDGQPPIEGTVLTAIFSEDARVAGSAGCNRYFGRANAVTGRMLVGPLGSTLMACEANGVMTQEQRFLELMQAASSYSVTGDQLRLGPSANTITLVFTAQ
ncbi:MAG TPA: META domain-containing protein [Planctomycetota bacterium]|nr:META domain-containing protein [Planctomycetota bacterium]